MGTRATVEVHKYGGPLVSIQFQSDGYPSGVGAELVDFLVGGKLINGFRDEERGPKVWNGLECLAAMLVWHFKKGSSGDVYLQSPLNAESIRFESYNYRIEEVKGALYIQVIDRHHTSLMFQGDVASFAKWVAEN